MTTLIIWALIISDPYNLAFNKVFSWTWLIAIVGLQYWFICFGYQFYRQVKEDYASKNYLEIPDMRTSLNNDVELKKDFYEFAEKQYVVESVNFLEDISSYKQFFYDKADNWKLSKFNSLVEKYIKPGANYEVNISYSARLRILKLYEEEGKGNQVNELYKIFDKVSEEVETILTNGAWRMFILNRMKNAKKLSKQVSPIAALTATASMKF